MIQSNMHTTNPIGREARLNIQSDDGPDSLTPPVMLIYWHVITRWKWIILGIIGVALAVGLVTTLLMTPRYTANSRIEISREQKNVTNVQGLESADVARDVVFYLRRHALDVKSKR